MADIEPTDILKGTTLDIYRLFLKTNKPLGIREVQRKLNLSSPSVAQHHIMKLERAGLIKKENGSYVIDKVFLENFIKIRRFLVPKYLFYSIFALLIVFLEVTVMKPEIITREYFFFIMASLIFTFIFCFETFKVWLKGSL